jgi:serine/threonine-protein kinase
MSRVFTCPQGHQWRLSSDQPLSDGHSPACPVCGALAAPITGRETDVADHANPAPQSAAAPAERHGSTAVYPSGDRTTPPFVPPLPRADSGPHGRFTRLRPHAQGGLGQVSLARDEDLRRAVALKEIRAEWADDPIARRRFFREAEITGQLEHPGIVPVYALGHDPGGRPYYAMRFVHGRTLAEAIADYHARPSPLAFRDLLRRFGDVCQAIAYAHSQGVIHRDLKPANVMLGEYGETLVLDWGLAKRVGDGPDEEAAAAGEPGLTQTGQVLGTPPYLAPEQAAGAPDAVGPPADVYALGVILYEMLSGRSPYDGTNAVELLAQMRAGPPRPLSQVGRGVPRALEAVCLKAMAQQPAERYPTATALAREVERWLADEPVEACREPWLTRLRRWARRHRPLVAGAAAAVFVAVATLTLATVLLQRARGLALLREKEAEEQRDAALAKYQLARTAVDQMLTEVAEKQLLHVREMDPVRRALLEKALAFYQGFLREKSTDPALRQETGRAYRRVADIYGLLGRYEDAVQNYGQALAVHGALAEEFPEEPPYRRDLAEDHHNLGYLYHQMRRSAEAEPAYRRARDVREQLVAARPDSAADADALASTYSGLGQLYHETGRPEAARADLEKARDIWDGLVQAHPSEAGYRHHLAISQHGLGPLYRDAGKFDRAESAFRAGIAGWTSLAREQPAVKDYRQGLASCYQHLGFLYDRHLGRLSEAEAPYREALRLRAELAREHPAVPVYQIDLAQSHRALGAWHQQTGQLARAGEAYQTVLALYEKLDRENPDVPLYQNGLSDTYHTLGWYYQAAREPAKAEAAYRKAADLRKQLLVKQPTVTHHLFWLAQIYHDWGMFYGDRRPVEAQAAYREAVELRERLCGTSPNAPDYQKGLAWSYSNLGDAFLATGQPAEAEAAHQKSLALWAQLAGKYPKVHEYAAGLGAAYSRRASRLHRAGKSQEALDWHARAIRTLEAVLRREAQHTDARESLREAYASRAETWTRLGRDADALQDLERALTYAAGSAREPLRLDRAAALARLGQHERAVSDARAVVAQGTPSGGLLAGAARVQALAAAAVRRDDKLPPAERERRAESYAAGALELLNRARAAGYFKSPAEIEPLKDHSDFEPLRTREGFQKLLRELTTSGKS